MSILSLRSYALCLSIICLSLNGLFAQEKPTTAELLAEYSFSVDDLSDPMLTKLVSSKIEESQFILIGESHGIVEAGVATQYFYELAYPNGFNTLCVETDPLAARIMSEYYKSDNPVEAAVELDKQYTFSIPFYNNYEDFKLFDALMANKGQLWGIDQSLMSQFRLNFSYLMKHTKSKVFYDALAPQHDAAVDAFNYAVENRDFMAAYIFKYDETLHNELLELAPTDAEKQVLMDLWKSKEIYSYYFQGQYYLNNQVRGQLMKSNFMSYYRAAQQKTDLPKVIFKLGSNHAARGLTATRIYDIGNLASELAISNGKRSLNVLVVGASGFENRANPIEPEKSKQAIDYSGYLPDAMLDLAKASEDKYVVIKAEEMLPIAHQVEAGVRDFLFKFDLVILVNGARALSAFGGNKKEEKHFN